MGQSCVLGRVPGTPAHDPRATPNPTYLLVLECERGMSRPEWDEETDAPPSAPWAWCEPGRRRTWAPGGSALGPEQQQACDLDVHGPRVLLRFRWCGEYKASHMQTHTFAIFYYSTTLYSYIICCRTWKIGKGIIKKGTSPIASQTSNEPTANVLLFCSDICISICLC